jgi:hypothetical protein
MHANITQHNLAKMNIGIFPKTEDSEGGGRDSLLTGLSYIHLIW